MRPVSIESILLLFLLLQNFLVFTHFMKRGNIIHSDESNPEFKTLLNVTLKGFAIIARLVLLCKCLNHHNHEFCLKQKFG